MRQATLRWTCYLLALLVLGPIAGSLVAGLRAADGGYNATALISTSPIKGIFLTIIALAIAAAAGLAAARLTTARAGLTTAGLTLVWAAWRSAEVEQIIRAAHATTPMWALAIEGAIWVAAAAVIAAAIERIGGLDHTNPAWTGREHQGDRPPPLSLTESIRATVHISPAAFAAAVAAGGVAAWLVAAQGLKGQTVAAGVVAGLAAAAIGRAIDTKAAAPAFFLPGIVVALVSPVAGVVLAQGSIVDATYAGTLAPIARVAPLDWAAGWLLGVPMGLGWATSLVSERLRAKHA